MRPPPQRGNDESRIGWKKKKIVEVNYILDVGYKALKKEENKHPGTNAKWIMDFEQHLGA